MADNPDPEGGENENENGQPPPEAESPQTGDPDVSEEQQPAGGDWWEQGPSIPGYEALAEYDPKLEFEFIEKAREKIDERLLRITSPFAVMIIRMIWLAAFGVLWSAVAVPLLEAADHFGLTLSTGWHLLLILAVPILCAGTVFVWMVLIMPIRLRWAAVHIEMYLDDEISNRLIQDGGTWVAEIKGYHMGANEGLLGLLRLRMKAFHFWHRISIHAFILQGAFFRKVLETPFVTPRLFANGAPIVVLIDFVSIQTGVFLSGNRPSGFFALTGAFFQQIWTALTVPKLGASGIPVIVPLLLGLALSYGAYVAARSGRPFLVKTLEGFLKTDSFLTPYTHDFSRDILREHRKLIRIIARFMTRGRNGQGDGASEELGDLILGDGDGKNDKEA